MRLVHAPTGGSMSTQGYSVFQQEVKVSQEEALRRHAARFAPQEEVKELQARKDTLNPLDFVNDPEIDLLRDLDGPKPRILQNLHTEELVRPAVQQKVPVKMRAQLERSPQSQSSSAYEESDLGTSTGSESFSFKTVTVQKSASRMRSGSTQPTRLPKQQKVPQNTQQIQQVLLLSKTTSGSQGPKHAPEVQKQPDTQQQEILHLQQKKLQEMQAALQEKEENERVQREAEAIRARETELRIKALQEQVIKLSKQAEQRAQEPSQVMQQQPQIIQAGPTQEEIQALINQQLQQQLEKIRLEYDRKIQQLTSFQANEVSSLQAATNLPAMETPLFLRAQPPEQTPPRQQSLVNESLLPTKQNSFSQNRAPEEKQPEARASVERIQDLDALLEEQFGNPAPKTTAAAAIMATAIPETSQVALKQQKKANKLLALEVENLEKVLMLQEDHRRVLEQDHQSQQEIVKKKTQELQRLQTQVAQLPRAAVENKEAHFRLVQLKLELREKQQTKQLYTSQRKRLHNQIEDLKGQIRVMVRLRPQTLQERPDNAAFSRAFQIADDQTVFFTPQAPNGLQPQKFQYYRVYGETTHQQTVFNDIKPLIQSALDGYNVFIGGYGNTGSGKTYTILGDDGTSQSVEKEPSQRLGVLPRAVVELFKGLADTAKPFAIEVAMLELYMDQLIDLLPDEGIQEDLSNLSNLSNLSGMGTEIPAQSKLQIRKTHAGDTVVKGLSWVKAASAPQVLDLLGQGLSRRHIAGTALNERSSRSHTIIYLRIKQELGTSTIIFADLAGSERAEKASSTGLRAKEAQYINQSLSALGDVMNALSTKKPFVPYRNNKLTMLLQPGLGGNSKAVLLVCISPLVNFLGETYQSLMQGSRARAVVNVASKGLYE